jgi:hypothetical protein
MPVFLNHNFSEDLRTFGITVDRHSAYAQTVSFHCVAASDFSFGGINFLKAQKGLKLLKRAE